MNKLDMKSENIVDDNIEYIREKFPNVVVESEKGYAIDFNALKQELSDVIVDETKEKYQLTWPGKKESIVTANTPTTKTLRPVREKSVNFDTTENIYIEGDNLEALKILQESYLGKIKCIYIDPPYNTGNDFIYNDNFNKDSNQELLESGQIDEDGNRLVTNNHSNGKFHSDWLSMMYPRLKLARNLLSNDGVIFISIDDNEQENLKKICDEIYGESNFVATLINQRAKGGGQAKYFVKGHDYIFVYAKRLNSNLKFTQEKIIQQPIVLKDGKKYIKNDDVVRKMFGKYDKSANDRRCFYEELEKYKGIKKKQEIDELIKIGKYTLELNKYGMHTIVEYIPVEEATSKIYSIIKVLSEKGKQDLIDLGLDEYFDYPKPVELLKILINSICQENDIVLDFFSGSATLAQAVMELNSKHKQNMKYILIQLSEKCYENSEAYNNGYKTICDIGEERIRRAAKKIKEETNTDIDYGFRVYKIDSSNMKDVYYKPSELNQEQLDLFETNIKDDRNSEDLLTQVILDLGLTLDLKIEEKNILGNKVYFVDSNSLVACFDDNLNINIVDEICKYKPLKVVFKDSSFKNDNDKINLEEKIKKLSPDTEINIL